MNKTKFISLILALFMLASLTACGQSAESSAEVSTPDEAVAVMNDVQKQDATSAVHTESVETEPTEPSYELLQEKVANMTLQEKVGQMFFVALPDENAAETAKQYNLGGYILFGRDFYRTNKKGMKKLISSIQKKSDIPALMGVDEEGGTVVRASLYSKYRKKKFRSPRQVYKAGGYKAITKDTKNKDRFLKSLGLNCNFGPVADVPYRRSNFIYDRSVSTSTGRTKKFVKLTVTQMGSDGVVSALKHFPGYGGNGDTHSNIIRDKRSLRTFEHRDLKPFAAGIKAGADMIMLSHIKVDAFDSKRPASLSKKVNKYLRNVRSKIAALTDQGLNILLHFAFLSTDGTHNVPFHASISHSLGWISVEHHK